jgi:hypothetical protein
MGIGVMRLIDGGEIRGLKSSNQALKDHLDLATKKQSVLTPEIEQLKAEMAELRREQGELKETHTPQLESLSATTASIVQRLESLSQANTVLGQTLNLAARGQIRTGTSTLPTFKIKPPDGPPKSTSGSA